VTYLQGLCEAVNIAQRGSGRAELANQEDSLIFSSSSIQRGLFRSTSLKKYITSVQKNHSTAQDDLFMKPDPSRVVGMRHASYDKLNDKGYVPEETVIVNGDIIIGKVSPIQPTGNNNKIYKDSSEVYKSHAPGTIDKVYTGIYNNDGYEMMKCRVRSMRSPVIGDKFCMIFSADVDVLTSEGWKKMADVTKEDFIATLSEGKYLKYEKPTDIIKFKYKGEVYKLRSQQVDLDVTVDHRLYARKRNKKEFELIPAIDLAGKRYNLKKDCENDYPDVEYMTLPSCVYRGKKMPAKKIKYDDFLDLLGIFIADGYVDGHEIVIAGEKQRKIEHMEAICNNLDVTIQFEKDPSTHLNNLGLGCRHRIMAPQIARYLEPLSVGAINKFLPDYVWNLSQRQARLLLDSMITGDGSHNLQGAQCYYTSSKQLADDTMRLAIHAGWSASIKLIRPEGSHYKIPGKNRISEGTSNADALSVRIVKCKNEPEINHGQILTQDAQTEEIYDYEGDVWCLEVPSHVFMIRQNMKNVFIGNCSSHGQKGTIGLLMKASDMMFSGQGISPDIILNPNAIPSRMTIGQLVECILGKVSAIEGHDADGTPFNDIDLEQVKDRLEKNGFHRDGVEYMYNGMTGQKMKIMIFIGPTYYRRLKHLVEDKLHCLSRDHEVLTQGGWKMIYDITKDDLVAILKDGKTVYEKPLAVYHYPNYRGKIYNIKSEKIDLSVTINHRMWVSVKNENYDIPNAADKLWGEWELVQAKDIIGKCVKYQTIDGEIMIDTVREESCEDFVGEVYCLQVSTEIFCVRRNGKAVWTGNSRARGPRTILTRRKVASVNVKKRWLVCCMQAI